MSSHYSPGFVVASIMIAFWGSIAALALSGRIHVSTGSERTWFTTWTASPAEVSSRT